MMNQSFYLVAGLGKTGYSIASYLRQRNKPFVAFDTRQDVANLSAFAQEFPGVDVFSGELPATLYSQLAGIITSPGIDLNSSFLQPAFQRNIPVFGDVECLAREIKAPVVAITGTNGKSTVTTLVGEMAKAAGLSVAVAGNIGQPVLELLDDGKPYDLWVLELSSFQLDLICSLKPIAATILNISPDHLDRHLNLTTYTLAKQRIYQHAQFLLYNRADQNTIPPKQPTDFAVTASFGLDRPTTEHQWGLITHQEALYFAQGDKPLLPVEQLRLKGKHNWENALAACALASQAGIELTAIIDVLKTFPGLAHRCQWVRNLNGVDWINDSKGTNIGATISAIAGIGDSIPGKIVLIAGGQGKGADFTELQSSVNNHVRSVVLIGEDADKIAQALNGVVPLVNAFSLENAINLAKLQAKPGDVVLLSPACASFDMFRDFNHRGDCFMQLVEKL